MKKLLTSFISFILLIFTSLSLIACNTEKDEVNVYVVDGAPVISVANLIEDRQIENTKVKVNVVPNIDALTGAIGRGEADVAVCPINVASTLYNGGVDYKLLSVNIFGVLHIVGKNAVTLDGLKGQTVYNIGKGGTPDVTLKYILNKNNIAFTENLDEPLSDKVNLKYVSSANELMPLLKQGVAKYGVLGEPAVTKANSVANVSSVINLTEEWSKVCNYKYTQAGVIVSQNLIEKDVKFVKGLFETLKNSNNYAKENAQNLKSIISSAGSTLTVDFTSEIILRCNVDCKGAYQIKSDVEYYLSALMEYNKNVIGGKLPDKNFYINYENL